MKKSLLRVLVIVGCLSLAAVVAVPVLGNNLSKLNPAGQVVKPGCCLDGVAAAAPSAAVTNVAGDKLPACCPPAVNAAPDAVPPVATVQPQASATEPTEAALTDCCD